MKDDTTKKRGPGCPMAFALLGLAFLVATPADSASLAMVFLGVTSIKEANR